MIEPISIQAVHAFRVRLKVINDIGASKEDGEYVDNVVVNVATDAGIVGWGCAAPLDAGLTETLDDTLEALRDVLEPALLKIGMRPVRALLQKIEELAPDLPAARAALDIAVHDIWAKQISTSLVSVLGPFRFEIPSSATIPQSDSATTARQADDKLALGFKTLMIEGGSAGEDIDRVKLLRREFGRRIPIRLDARGGYDYDDALDVIKELKKDIELLEQPVEAGDVDALVKLANDSPIPIVADESARNESEAAALFERGIPMIKVNLMKCGGLGPAVRICELAQSMKKKVVIGGARETAISATAAAHLALSSPAVAHTDLDAYSCVEQKITGSGISIEKGIVTVALRPGLGVDVRKNYLKD